MASKKPVKIKKTTTYKVSGTGSAKTKRDMAVRMHIKNMKKNKKRNK